MRHIYILIFICFTPGAFAQFYAKEVGVRGGYTSAISFRVNLEEALSYEAQMSYRGEGLIFNLIRQQHHDLGMDRLGNWKFIYGFGPHAGFYMTDRYRIFFREIYFGSKIFTPVIGFDGYAALEYQLADLPASFGVDYHPFMEISLRQVFGINLWDFGVYMKYRF